MDSSVFLGGSVVAAVIAGSIALFAPCCVSVMLPAYFTSAFQNRRMLVAMTFVFAAGVASIILPIALGAAVVQRVLLGHHAIVYLGVAVVLVAMGVYVLAGGKIRLPAPGARGGSTGPLGVYTLGLFSGAASSCCAPVLAGVIALSGLASSFLVALGLGAAYVFGMVAPLFAMSLLWDRVDWRSSRLLKPRSFTWRLGPVRRTVSGTAVASGTLLVLMGAGTLYFALAGMPSPSGWEGQVTSRLQHYGRLVTDALSWIPGWAAVVVVVALLGLLARRAFRELLGDTAPEPSSTSAAASSSPEPASTGSSRQLA